jgi:sugar phosphate isomerase/epimerase
MNHALSTHLWANHRLTANLLAKIEQAGIPEVEIFCAKQHLDHRDRAQIAELGHWFRDSELKLRSVHSPMFTDDVWGRSGPHAVINITEPVKSSRMPMIDEIKRAIEIAETVPFRYLIQHIGVGGEEFDPRKFDSAFTALEELRVFARQLDVEILLENIPNELSTAARLREFQDLTHIGLNYVFDVGHAHLAGSVEAAFHLMKDRIRSTHVHDNDGTTDAHLFPFSGSIDWKTFMPFVRSCGDRSPLLLELKERPGLANPIEEVRKVLDRLEEL